MEIDKGGERKRMTRFDVAGINEGIGPMGSESTREGEERRQRIGREQDVDEGT